MVLKKGRKEGKREKSGGTLLITGIFSSKQAGLTGSPRRIATEGGLPSELTSQGFCGENVFQLTGYGSL